MTSPAEFADAEVIKSRLESMEEKLATIIGMLEALQASVDGLAEIQRYHSNRMERTTDYEHF